MMAGYPPFFQPPYPQNQDDLGHQTPYSARPPYPPQGYGPTGVPMQTLCPPQDYTFVQGVGFVLRTPQEAERQGIRRFGKLLGLSLLFYILLFYTVRPAAGFFILRVLVPALHITPSAGMNGIAGTAVASLTATLAPFLVYRRSTGIPFSAALPMKRPRMRLLLPALLITLGLAALGSIAAGNLAAVLRFFGFTITQNTVALPYDAAGIALYLFNFVLLAPILEELIFRGIVMQSLRRFGDAFALVASAVVFAAMHLDFLSMPYALLAGLALGYFVLRTDSLVTGIVIHFCNNLFSVLYEYFARGLSPDAGALTYHCLLIAYLLLGVIAFFAVARHSKGIFTLHPAGTLLDDSCKLRFLFSSGAMLLVLVLVSFIAAGNASLLIRLP